MTAREMERNEIHRKVGRNIILLQRLELLLKECLRIYNISIPYLPTTRTKQDQEKKDFELRKQEIFKKTMGGVVGELSGTLLNDTANDLLPKTLAANEYGLSINWSIGPSEANERLRSKLKKVVNDRNMLVHELLMSFNTATGQGRTEVVHFLDQQYEEVSRVFEDLNKMRESFVSSTTKFLKDSSMWSNKYECVECAGVKELLVCFYVFSVYLGNQQRLFGWAKVSQAKKYLDHHFSEALIECQKKYKVKSLKKILLKTGLFDLLYLPFKNGHYTVLYKLKEGLRVECDRYANGELYFCRDFQTESGLATERIELQMSMVDKEEIH